MRKGDELQKFKNAVEVAHTQVSKANERVVALEEELAERVQCLKTEKKGRAEIAEDGDVIAIKAELADAEAKLADAKAELAVAKAELAVAKAELAVAKAELAVAEAKENGEYSGDEKKKLDDALEARRKALEEREKERAGKMGRA